MARVEVECFIESCQSCSTKSLCIGQDQSKSKGILTARNPLHAGPGDEVDVEIPEANYSKALILLFGSLLVASLLGIGLGALLSPFLPFTSSVSSFLGFLCALVVVGFVLVRYFRGKNKTSLYPVIIGIAKEGKKP